MRARARRWRSALQKATAASPWAMSEKGSGVLTDVGAEYKEQRHECEDADEQPVDPLEQASSAMGKVGQMASRQGPQHAADHESSKAKAPRR